MKKTWRSALLLVLYPFAYGYAQENAGEEIKICQELAGEYEFYIPKAYVLARVFVDKGILWTQDEGDFCGLLKHHKIGVLVGTETGGTFECNDASHLVNLWNTGLKLYVARMTFTAAVQGMTKTTGIEPDYPVEPRIEDIINGRDAIKECAFALIDRPKGMVAEGGHHRSVFPHASTKGIRWLFGAGR